MAGETVKKVGLTWHVSNTSRSELLKGTHLERQSTKKAKNKEKGGGGEKKVNTGAKNGTTCSFH